MFSLFVNQNMNIIMKLNNKYKIWNGMLVLKLCLGIDISLEQ